MDSNPINMYTSGFFSAETKLPSNYDVASVCVTFYVNTQINIYDFFSVSMNITSIKYLIKKYIKVYSNIYRRELQFIYQIFQKETDHCIITPNITTSIDVFDSMMN